MRVSSGVTKLSLAIGAPDFTCVKVRATADVVLAALSSVAFGVPRDLVPVIRGAPAPSDGSDLERRAVVYKLERDSWTTILREGDRYAGYDSLLAQRLSRVLGTRAFALFQDGGASDLAYDVFESGKPVASALVVDGNLPESSGVDRALLALAPDAHARRFLAAEDATNDRLSFRQFLRPGLLRGRWDLGFERAILIPDLPVLEEDSQERRVRASREARVPANVPAPSPAMSREGERGLRGILDSIIADTTKGL
jgi:hypothetical protein